MENIPGFKDGCPVLSDDERAILRKGSITPEQYAKEVGMLSGTTVLGDPSKSINEKVIELPSIQVVNMNVGKPHGGNSIQDSAQATISIRTAPGQDPDKVGQAVIDHLCKQPVLQKMKMKVKNEISCHGWRAKLSSPFTKKYLAALEENFTSASAPPVGGGLPLLREFEQVFPNMEMIVPGVEDPDTAAHSHNESQDLSVLRNAINSLISFMEKAGDK